MGLQRPLSREEGYKERFHNKSSSPFGMEDEAVIQARSILAHQALHGRGRQSIAYKIGQKLAAIQAGNFKGQNGILVFQIARQFPQIDLQNSSQSFFWRAPIGFANLFAAKEGRSKQGIPAFLLGFNAADFLFRCG